MTGALFIVCALALPPANKPKELEMLESFIALSPSYNEFYFSEKNKKPSGKGWKKSKFEIGNYSVWERKIKKSA